MYMLWEPKEIIFKVKDLGKVRSFYKAVLLLRILEEVKDKFVIFDLGSALLKFEYGGELGLPDDFGKASQIVFKIRSVADILEALHKLGVDYSIEDYSDGRQLDIADPEGRIITFISKY